jgi:hypothetical protein
MRTFSLLALLGLGAILTGCNEGESTGSHDDCLTLPLASRYIIVTAPTAGPGGVCQATVVARSAGFEQTLLSDGRPCNWYTLPDREGLYQVTVEATGYQTVVRENVLVGGGYGCSGPEDIKIQLERP